MKVIVVQVCEPRRVPLGRLNQLFVGTRANQLLPGRGVSQIAGGWRLTILTILLGAFSGSIAGILLMYRRGSRNMQMMLPFGIFLGIGSIVSLLVGTRIIIWYASMFR